MPDFSNKKLNLSMHQRQVLSELEIDAWYLDGLRHRSGDTVFEQQQVAIAEVVDEISETLHLHEATPHSKQAITEAVSTSEHETVQKLVTQVAQKTRLSPSSKVPVTTVIKPIRLPTEINHKIADDGVIVFPSAESIAVDWEVLHQQLNQLSVEKEVDTLAGSGNQRADWLIVLPPPSAEKVKQQTLLDNGERHLLTGVLSHLHLAVQDVYLTPLIKQAITTQLDPDEALLSQYLPFLAAEVQLVRPKQILLMGRVVNQTLLQTTAPLSAIMQGYYQLVLQEASNMQMKVYSLPSLQYFLAIPSEKYRLWQFVKAVA